jgi:GNAT superfamily N-acetyltransferase
MELKLSITIRPGLLFDVDKIAEFQIKMALETEKLNLDLPVVIRGVSAVLDDPTKGKYWVAEVNSQIAGCLLTISEWSDWRNGAVLWIHSVYVEPKFRRAGVFKALYLHLKENVLSSPELRGLRLYVDKTNLVAQKVYTGLEMDREHYHLYEWMKS